MQSTIHILTAIAAAAFSVGSPLGLAPVEAATNVQIGDATVIRTDSQMPFTMDASFATLTNGDGTVTFFETAMGNSPYFFRYTGTAADPLQTAQSAFVWNDEGYNLQLFAGSLAITPTNTGNFVNGVWNGTVTVLDTATTCGCTPTMAAAIPG